MAALDDSISLRPVFRADCAGAVWACFATECRVNSLDPCLCSLSLIGRWRSRPVIPPDGATDTRLGMSEDTESGNRRLRHPASLAPDPGVY